MSLTELQAQQVTLVRVLEQTRDNDGLWSAQDAREATGATMDIMGAKPPFDQFVARRAEWALEEINKRPSSKKIYLREPRWPILVGWLLVFLALLTGVISDHLATDRRVNVVEYPLVGLILWNLMVFVVILSRRISWSLSKKHKPVGTLIQWLGELRMREVFLGPTRSQSSWFDQFQKEWNSLSASLNRIRLELVLHAAAMLFALGALASLYYRGAFKDYRAVWESTLFSAETIHSIACIVLTPGAILLNMQIPDVQHIASLRVPGGTGESALNWLHLYAGSILVWIIVPRFLLAITSSFSRWHLRCSFPLPINGPYFTTLQAMRRGGNIGVLAIPFRYELTPQIRSNLSNLLKRIHGLTVDITIQQPVFMGEDTKDWKAALGSDEHIAVFVVFNLTATAESDAHGQLLKQILNDVGGRVPVIPIVDTGTYADRDKERFRQRCNQWRNVLDKIRCKPLFLNLSTPDDNDVQKELEARLNQHE